MRLATWRLLLLRLRSWVNASAPDLGERWLGSLLRMACSRERLACVRQCQGKCASKGLANRAGPVCVQKFKRLAVSHWSVSSETNSQRMRKPGEIRRHFNSILTWRSFPIDLEVSKPRGHIDSTWRLFLLRLRSWVMIWGRAGLARSCRWLALVDGLLS